MIEWYQALMLALIQGLTEFLPISSSAHLVIPSLVMGWPDQGLAFDVAVHLGTLLAVMFYYRRDLHDMALSWGRALTGGGGDDNSALVWYLALATLPSLAVGFFGRGFIESELRTLPVIATTTLVFGLLLGLANRRSQGVTEGLPMTVVLAVAIGCAQAMALVPGVSRSGVTITAALLMGMDRLAAARFSFLLSIPIIAGAGSLKTWDLINAGAEIDWQQMALGVLVSAVTAYLCIALFIRLLERMGMMPFVYYRIALALFLYGLWLL